MRKAIIKQGFRTKAFVVLMVLQRARRLMRKPCSDAWIALTPKNWHLTWRRLVSMLVLLAMPAVLALERARQREEKDHQ